MNQGTYKRLFYFYVINKKKCLNMEKISLQYCVKIHSFEITHHSKHSNYLLLNSMIK
jgi:hypothetical protein